MNAPRSPGRHSDQPEDGSQPRDQPLRRDRPAPEPLSERADSLEPAVTPAPRCVPATPGELVAMQQLAPEQGADQQLEQMLSLLRHRELTPWESQQIALMLIQELEAYHRGVLAELQDSPQGTAARMACWAIDADRLMHCRRLLESITLT